MFRAGEGVLRRVSAPVPATFAAEVGGGFVLRKQLAEQHVTPWGKLWSFNFAISERCAFA